MSVFVIYMKSRDVRSCHCCAEPGVWELHGSNHPQRKFSACDAHREEARLALVEELEIARRRWQKVESAAVPN